jgi:hypothetical protein
VQDGERLRHLNGAPNDGASRGQRLGDDFDERRCRGEQLMVIGPGGTARDAEHPPGSQVHHLDAAAAIDDQQSGGEAVHDLAAQFLGSRGAGSHLEFLRLQLGDRLLKGRGQQRGLAIAAAAGAARLASSGDEAKQRERHDRSEYRDSHGEADERVAGLVHGHLAGSRQPAVGSAVNA